MTKKIAAFFVIFCFSFEQCFAQVSSALSLSNAFSGIHSMDRYRPVHLRSLMYDRSQNDFGLLLDKGDARNISIPEARETAGKLMEYFRIGLALPDSTFWVNLRPDSKDNIIDPELEKTDAGKVMLAADLQLKKDMALSTSPSSPEGRKYWDRLYAKAETLYGSRHADIPTLTRPWIVPGEIIVREAADSVYVYKAVLQVKLEQDYLKGSAQFSFSDPRMKELNEYSSQLIRELILPSLIRKVNSSKAYAELRQVYYSLVLAQWFKKHFRGTSARYAAGIDTRALSGLISASRWSKDTYYDAYRRSFSDGEYDSRENVTRADGMAVRNYVSGGMMLAIQPETDFLNVPGRDGGVKPENIPGVMLLKGKAVLDGGATSELEEIISVLTSSDIRDTMIVRDSFNYMDEGGQIREAKKPVDYCHAVQIGGNVLFVQRTGDPEAIRAGLKELAPSIFGGIGLRKQQEFVQRLSVGVKKADGGIDTAKWTAQPFKDSEFNPDMFRDYDYRSTGFHFNARMGFVFGLTWATMALAKAKLTGNTNRAAVIARDPRKIDLAVASAISDAFRYMGLDVIYTAAEGPNCVTSYSWAVQQYKPLISVFITASHVSRPKEEEVIGFKVAVQAGPGGSLQSLTTKEIKQVSREGVLKFMKDPGSVPGAKADREGTFFSAAIEENCIRFNTLVGQVAAAGGSLYALGKELKTSDPLSVLAEWGKKFAGQKPLSGIKIVVEGAGTPSGQIAARTFEGLGAQVILLNGEIQEVEGEHKADPSVEKNLEGLKAGILAQGADMGIAFDLDGDRGAVVCPVKDANGKIRFETLAPDNMIAAMLPYLVKNWGYSTAETGKKVGVIRDVLGTSGVNDTGTRMGADVFQTDAGYVFLKALRQKLLDRYVIPIYGERSGHCWLDVSGEIENPVAVAVLYAVMVKAEKYRDSRPVSDNAFFATYQANTVPYLQSPRFQPVFHPALLSRLSSDSRNTTGWKFDPASTKNPPQMIIALGKDTAIKAIKEEFTPGKAYAGGKIIVKEVNAYQDSADEGGLYRFADIVFSDAKGGFCGRFVFRASANDPTFVCSYETPERGDVGSALGYFMNVGGAVLDWAEKNGLALVSLKGIEKQLSLSSEKALEKARKFNLVQPGQQMELFRKSQGLADGGISTERVASRDGGADERKAELVRLARIFKKMDWVLPAPTDVLAGIEVSSRAAFISRRGIEATKPFVDAVAVVHDYEPGSGVYRIFIDETRSPLEVIDALLSSQVFFPAGTRNKDHVRDSIRQALLMLRSGYVNLEKEYVSAADGGAIENMISVNSRLIRNDAKLAAAYKQTAASTIYGQMDRTGRIIQLSASYEIANQRINGMYGFSYDNASEVLIIDTTLQGNKKFFEQVLKGTFAQLKGSRDGGTIEAVRSFIAKYPDQNIRGIVTYTVKFQEGTEKTGYLVIKDRGDSFIVASEDQIAFSRALDKQGLLKPTMQYMIPLIMNSSIDGQGSFEAVVAMFFVNPEFWGGKVYNAPMPGAALFSGWQVIARTGEEEKALSAKINECIGKAGTISADGGYADEDAPAAPIDQGNPVGGIAFQQLQALTLPAAAVADGGQLSAVPLAQLKAQWRDIRLEMAKGGKPYLRIKEFVSACSGRKDAAGQLKAVSACVSGMLKSEEEEAVPTSPEMKELLLQLG
ncbi:MAG: hypothetical protein ACM3OC_06270 [Deltaproteobacteria bacterium]